MGIVSILKRAILSSGFFMINNLRTICYWGIMVLTIPNPFLCINPIRASMYMMLMDQWVDTIVHKYFWRLIR